MAKMLAPPSPRKHFHSFAFPVVLCLLSLWAVPAQASGLLLHCALEGHGAYVYHLDTNIDDFEWSGVVHSCASPAGAVTPERGLFRGHGHIDGNAAFTGAGELTLLWINGQTSTLSFTMAGLPELLVMSGTVSSGLYEGQALTMEFHCKLKDTQRCFELGSSTWEFLGTLELSD